MPRPSSNERRRQEQEEKQIEAKKAQKSGGRIGSDGRILPGAGKKDVLRQNSFLFTRAGRGKLSAGGQADNSKYRWSLVVDVGDMVKNLGLDEDTVYLAEEEVESD